MGNTLAACLLCRVGVLWITCRKKVLRKGSLARMLVCLAKFGCRTACTPAPVLVSSHTTICCFYCYCCCCWAAVACSSDCSRPKVAYPGPKPSNFATAAG